MALYSLKPIIPTLLLILLNFIFLVEATATSTVTSPKKIHDVLCIESEKQELLSFKQDLVDPMNRLSSWVANGDDCCKWTGIVCDNITAHVTHLRLANPLISYDFLYHEVTSKYNGALSGKVNPSILNLTYLTHLDLSYNDFGGTQIPSFMGSLMSLKYLNLTRTGFEGNIPYQLGNLSSLSHLILYSDYVIGYYRDKLYADNLHWLSYLSSLEYLEMRVNLSATSDHWLLSINKIPSLMELHLSSCELTNIHQTSDVNFTSLKVLDISFNNFNSLMPNWIFNLSRLVHLGLGGYDFEGPLPNSPPKSLSTLKYLDVSYGNLNSLPNWFFGLKNMAKLLLGGNNLDASIACHFHNMTILKYFDIYGNNFNSTIPRCLYSLKNLEMMRLSSNHLHGVVSNAIENLTSMFYLDLSYNALEGKIPPSMGSLSNLQIISLNENKFEGDISDALESLIGCNPKRITSLSLGGNFFSGQPKDDTIEMFENLTYLSLARNMLSGLIPRSLGKLSALMFLDIAGNQFKGTLLESLGSLSTLEALYISNNLLEGVVSEIHFANLTNLIYLDASGNSLTLRVSPYWIPPFQLSDICLRSWSLGPQFPNWLKSQKYLQFLDLSQTGISFAIPNRFWKLSTNFCYLNLSHNQISGGIPDMHFNSKYICMIYLSSNKFEGHLSRISSSVTELDLSNNSLSGDTSHHLCGEPNDGPNKLTILHLGDNALSGNIPDCWKYLPSLEVINLSNANLTGQIPKSIGSLHRLKSLHLRNNTLSGDILMFLQNCTMLSVIDIGLNNIVGSLPKWIGISLPNLMFLGFRSNKMSGMIPSELCHLNKLQILDIAYNNFSGTIPRCFGDFKGMINKSSLSGHLISYSFYTGVFMENAIVVMKGREGQYNTILSLVASIDLSNNNLSGDFPIQLTNLHSLQSLNLSRNSLQGSIPNQIKDMDMLESLNLLMNQLSGVIPPSLSSLTFLNHLNLSYNNFSGEIPTSTQLQSMDQSYYIGNQLCGLPLLKKCREDHEITPNDASTEDEEEKYWFRLGIAVGFGVGFAGVIGPLLACGLWRRAYFWFFNEYMWYKIEDCFIRVRYKLQN
ncbi:receptor-like protein EIX2 [Humulus lupulus]|uniref:receptor-like protein EIX2 n=1 Tax=Humulus lupulus TaxID=3486 RepID=UPI002B417069|nr:receptor-like protein EIX2 [Humulus lupulus]